MCVCLASGPGLVTTVLGGLFLTPPAAGTDHPGRVRGQVLNAGAWVNVSTQLPGDAMLLVCGALGELGLQGDPSHRVQGAHCEWRS